MKKTDVFISYKHHSEDGGVARDYSIAKELYEALTEAGISTFFSDETLFEFGISDYKKAIDNALDNTHILIVIATKMDYLSSGWVEYEYETFCEDILSGRNPTGIIVSYTDGISSKTMPRTLARFQNYDMKKAPVEKLVKYVENNLNKNISSETVERGKAKGTASANPASNTVNVTSSVVKAHHKSNYSSDYSNEFKRLEIQAQHAKESDDTSIKFVFENAGWPEDASLTVLDVGSAYGFVAADRFSPLPQVDKILCIDNNPRVIERARIRFAENEKMIFETVDIESPDFESRLREIMDRLDIPHIDIVFSALTLLHLKNPDRVLRRLRSFMTKGSYIILRGSDDGSKLCYPGYELMQSIIQKSLQSKGASDRANGRKQYTQLLDAGFRDVRMFSFMTDLSQFPFNERESLFQESFSYRIDNFKRLLDANPDGAKEKNDYEWMRNTLEEFENMFFKTDFWYCEYDYVGVGKL
ncbi:MAG: methyltransferase domain-containing protein [Ruminococcaceae bacterium]|nr:methyltransferase domain-containing protein [Oscillospiraceae bacterium]